MELQQGTSSGGSGDGTSVIVDGVSSSIRATVFDLTNSNPQAMALVDANGDQITSFGGGTQYTDGAAAPANPIGTIPVFNDGGTITAVSAANPLPVTATFSPSGTQDTNLIEVGGAAFALGQQLAAASLPVVLTAAQITTLTPQTDALTDTELRATPVPVSGTVAFSNTTIAVTNAGTFAVQAAQSGTWNITNVSGTVSLPTGASTLAEQQTQTTALQLLDNIVYTDGGVTPGSPVGAGIVFDDGGTITFVSDAAPLPVTATFTPSGTQDTNLVEVGGAAFALGQQLAAASLPVVLTAAQITTLTPQTDALTDTELRATPVPVSLTSTTITGTVAVTQSGAWTVTANAGTDLNTSALLTTTAFNAAFGTAGTADTQVLTVQGIASMTPLLVDGSGSTQPISGTVTVTQGTAANLNATVVGTGTFAVQAAQSGTWNIGTVTTITNAVTVTAMNLDIRDLVAASDSVSVHGDVGILSQLDLTNSNPATVAIVDANGDQITSFGGGVQYATNVAYQDGDTGTMALAVRDDTLGTLTEADGDYTALRTNSRGAQWVVHDGAISAAQSGTWNITNISGTISLPTGAATAANQQTDALTDTELRATPVPVSLTSTTITGTVAATQSGAWTVTANAGTDLNTSALLTTAAFNAAFGTAGTADTQVLTVQGIASMTPLLVDGSGSTQPISGTVTVTQATASNLNATVVGTGTFAVQAAQSGTWNITNISGTISLPTGAATAANQQTDALTDTELRATPVPVSGTVSETTSDTGTQANVAGSASSVTLLASNANRLGASIVNDSSAILYVKMGSTASATDYAVRMYPNDYLEVPFNYTGIITGIWASATGAARVTEYT